MFSFSSGSQEIAADPSSDFPARRQAGGVVELPVNAAVDATTSRLLRGGPETSIRSLHSRKALRGVREANAISSEEARQDRRRRAAERAVSRGVRRKRRRLQKRSPVRIDRLANAVDRSPVVVMVLAIPGDDGG